MFKLGRKPSQVILVVFLDKKITKIAKDKCTHRSTNTFNASISTHRKPSSLCGYTPYAHLRSKLAGSAASDWPDMYSLDPTPFTDWE